MEGPSALCGRPFLLPPGHCEERSDAAIYTLERIDCFAMLAMTKIWPLFAILSCSACGDRRPAAPTAAEQHQLDETDAMLNHLAANEEGPEASAPDPSNRSN